MTIDVRQQPTGPPDAGVRDRVRCAGDLTTRQRDDLLLQLVLAYRSGERDTWAPLILKFLETPLRIRVARYRPVDPAISLEDVYQELASQVLQDALAIPLDGPAFLERRLLLRSADRVSRWLQREHLKSQQTESIEVWAEATEIDEESDQDA
jgi:hypothetical protein